MFHVRWVTVMRENVWSLTTDSEWKHSLTLRVLFTLKHCEVLRLPEVKKCSRHLTLKCVDRDDFCAVATREEIHASPLNVCVGRLKAIYIWKQKIWAERETFLAETSQQSQLKKKAAHLPCEAPRAAPCIYRLPAEREKNGCAGRKRSKLLCTLSRAELWMNSEERRGVKHYA